MSKKGWKILTVVFAGAGVLMLLGAYLPNILAMETTTVVGDKDDNYVINYNSLSPSGNPYLYASQKGGDIPSTCIAFMYFNIPSFSGRITSAKLKIYVVSNTGNPIKITLFRDRDGIYPHKPPRVEDAVAVSQGTDVYEDYRDVYIYGTGWKEIGIPVSWIEKGEWLKFAVFEQYPSQLICWCSANIANPDLKPKLTIGYYIPPPKHYLTVKTNPSYCDVTVAGQTKNSGTSGATFYLTEGTYKVTVSKEGYKTKTTTVSLYSDKTITVTLEPEVHEYTLTVHTTPTYCTVEVMDGDTWTANSGASGKCTFTLEEDQYYVTVSKDGYKAETKIVTLDSNKDVYFTLEPEIQEYTLTVYVDPAGATVEVGGQTEIVPPSGVVEFTLEEGTYTVTIYKDGYNTVTRQVNLNQNVELHISLTPQRPDIAITHYMNVIGLTMLLLAIPCGVKGWYL